MSIYAASAAAITRPNPGMTSPIVLADAMEAPLSRISLCGKISI
jgi:hypothetical protein